jgi:hypothetical protein
MTRTEFRRLPKGQKIEAMVGWFLTNYEDPANSTPYESAEGGYQYIWGGPYDANIEIGDKFAGLFPHPAGGRVAALAATGLAGEQMP